MKNYFLSISAAAVIMTTAALAQQTTLPLTGSYVFYEQGAGVSQPIASIALISFDSGGGAVGTRYWRSPGSSYKSSLSGTYTPNPDGTFTLALAATTMPTDGSDPVTIGVNYQLVLPKSKTKAITAIRTDNGYFTLAQLIPAAAPGTLKGSFLFTEGGNGAPYAGLGQLLLDGANGITGSERVESIGVNSVNAINGNYSIGSDGFGTLTLNVPSTNLDGDAVITTSSYIFVNGVDQVYAIRTDANSAFISNLTAQ